MWDIQGVHLAPSRCKETAQHSPRHSVLKQCVYRERHQPPVAAGVLSVTSGWGHHAGSRTWAPGSWNSFPRTQLLAHSDYEMSSFTCMDGD